MADKIQENSLKPKRIKGDRGEVEQHSIADQIMAEKFAASKTVAASPLKAVKRAKIAFGGMV